MVFDREKARLGFASSAGLCSVNGTLECGASCNVIGPDYSIASIFTPLVIGIAAACGVVLLAAGYFCIRSCGSRRCPPPPCLSLPHSLHSFFVERRRLDPLPVPESRQRLLGNDVVSRPGPLSLQYR